MKKIRLLLIGPSGAGKTSFLNLINLQFQLKNLSLLEISSLLIKTDFLPGDSSNSSDVKTSTMSQTIRPMLYAISDLEIDDDVYDVEIIDTPGFLDTNGKGRDLENLALIRKYIGTLKLNGILIVIDKYRAIASDDSSVYVKNMLNQIVGSNSDKNVLTLITNTFNLPATEEEQIRERMGQFFYYDNDVFNKAWNTVKIAGENERKLQKHILPKLKGILEFFGGFEQKPVVGLQELDSKIEALRKSMELFYITERENILFQIKNSDRKPKKKISRWLMFFRCCLERQEDEPETKNTLQKNQYEIEIKLYISQILQNNRNSNVLMELSEFKKTKNQNFSEQTNQEMGIYLTIVETMEKVFQDSLLNNY